MNIKQLFKKHYLRLVFEGILRSSLAGLAIGLAVNAVVGVVTWFFSLGGIWLPIIIGLCVALVSGVLLYFLKYRPDTVEVARRLDALGLEERTVTMLELKGDDTYIARLQRTNAILHIEGVGKRKISIGVSRTVVILAVVALLFGSSATTVVGLADGDIIPPGNELLEDPYENYISVTYEVSEGGIIEGVADQLVAPGASTEPVIAIPEDGWAFVGWDDGSTQPERYETNVTTDLYFVANFEQIAEGGEEGDDMEDGSGKPGSNEGDEAEDLPEGGSADAESDQNGGQGDKGDASGSDGNSEGGQGSGQEEGEGKGEGQGFGAGGKWEDANQFIDGKTYYKDQLDMYYQYAMQIFEETGEIPPELREFFETYYDSIQ